MNLDRWDVRPLGRKRTARLALAVGEARILYDTAPPAQRPRLANQLMIIRGHALLLIAPRRRYHGRESATHGAAINAALARGPRTPGQSQPAS